MNILGKPSWFCSHLCFPMRFSFTLVVEINDVCFFLFLCVFFLYIYILITLLSFIHKIGLHNLAFHPSIYDYNPLLQVGKIYLPQWDDLKIEDIFETSLKKSEWIYFLGYLQREAQIIHPLTRSLDMEWSKQGECLELPRERIRRWFGIWLVH